MRTMRRQPSETMTARSSPPTSSYTRRQAVAAEGATAIEDQRRHGELTPEIAVTCEERGDRLAGMTLELTGPAGPDGIAAGVS